MQMMIGNDSKPTDPMKTTNANAAIGIQFISGTCSLNCICIPITTRPTAVPTADKMNKIFRPALSTKKIVIKLAINCTVAIKIDDSFGVNVEPAAAKKSVE